MHTSPRIALAAAVALTLALHSTPAQAATYTGAANGDWFTASNWNTQLIPILSESINVTGGRSVLASSGNPVGGAINLGTGANVNAGGTLTVNNGAQGTSASITVRAGSALILSGPGTQWTASGIISAQHTNSQVQVTNGAKLSVSGAGNDFYDYTAKLTVSGANSSYTSNRVTLYTCTFDFLDHATVSTGSAAMMIFEDNVATVNVSGGATWTLPSLAVGGASINTATGSATLNLTDGGTVNPTNGSKFVSIGRFGRVNIGTGGLAGVLNADTIQFTNAGGTLAFNHTDNVTLGAAILGTGAITKTGGGITTLTGVGPFNGSTTINGGILHLTGDLRSSAFTVNAAGTLSGSGRSGTVMLDDGILSPGALPGSGSKGILTIGSGSILDGDVRLEIGGLTRGTEYDSITVGGGGALTLGGRLTLTLTDNFQPSWGDTFQLFAASNFTGAFSTLQLPTLSGDMTWNTSQLASTGVVVAVPEPSALWLCLSAAALPVFRRRRA